MGYQYRCSKHGCRASKTLKKKIGDYLLRNRPKCPACKRDSLKPIFTYERARNKKRKCVCDGIPWPHRTGTAPWCVHSAREPTEEEWHDREHTLRSWTGTT